MSFINYAQREIILKIVYYGPGLCGKTTNIKFIYSGTNADARGKLISLETKQERTLFFDFLPLSLPGHSWIQDPPAPLLGAGQLFYSASRKLIMKGADGVVFVADSQRARKEANIISMEDLKENLEAYGYDIDKIPFVIQYNKRDLPTKMPVEELREDLNPEQKYPDFEACAVAPDGPGRLRDAQGGRQADPDGAQEEPLDPQISVHSQPASIRAGFSFLGSARRDCVAR